MNTTLAALLALVVGLLIGYAVGVSRSMVRAAARGTAQAEELATLRARLESATQALTDSRTDAEIRVEDADRRHLRAAAEAEERHEDELERLRTEHQRQLEELRSDTSRLADEFDALSRKALAANTEQFLTQAEERLRRSQREGAAELAKREEAVRQLVTPLEKVLAGVKDEVSSAERTRVQAQAALAEQLRGMRESSEALRLETSALVTALRSPQVRGQWGEMQLRRTVEAAGMLQHVDFSEQVQLEDGAKRPDLIVALPGGKQVVVDSKVAFNGYLEAMEARDEKTRSDRLAAHARQLRRHIDDLAAKEYWASVTDSPEFTVMFVPSEVFLNAALEQDPSLMEHAFGKNVVMATPATLVALLRTVAYTWRQEQLATEAAQVFRVGRELHKRLSTFGGHLTQVARRLNATVESFNAMSSSLDVRVVPSLQRFSALQGLDDALAVPPPLEIQAMPPHKPDLHRDVLPATEAIGVSDEETDETTEDATNQAARVGDATNRAARIG